eukprot:6201449-Lingulodinium_polyedra.AAC.1
MRRGARYGCRRRGVGGRCRAGRSRFLSNRDALASCIAGAVSASGGCAPRNPYIHSSRAAYDLEQLG